MKIIVIKRHVIISCSMCYAHFSIWFFFFFFLLSRFIYTLFFSHFQFAHFAQKKTNKNCVKMWWIVLVNCACECGRRLHINHQRNPTRWSNIWIDERDACDIYFAAKASYAWMLFCHAKMSLQLGRRTKCNVISESTSAFFGVYECVWICEEVCL